MELVQALPLFDLPAILPGARRFAKEADMADVLPPLDSELFRDVIIGMCNLPGSTIILAKEGGRVTGGIGILVTPYLWNPAKLAVHDLFWWAEDYASRGVGLALIEEAMRIADEQGATIRSFGALVSSRPGVARVYRKYGMRPVQVQYVGVR